MNRRSTGPIADQRGAIMVMAVFMAAFLVGCLWYLIGVGDALVYRERVQDAADAGAYSAAVYHARGMNLIALLNIVMAAMLAVLNTGAPRLNGLVFAVAFLSGGALVVAFVVAIGSIASSGRGGSSTAASSFELVLGLLLVAAGLRALRRPTTEFAPSEEKTRGRARAVLDRLERLTAKTAFGAGVLLGIGGPVQVDTLVAEGREPVKGRAIDDDIVGLGDKEDIVHIHLFVARRALAHILDLAMGDGQVVEPVQVQGLEVRVEGDLPGGINGNVGVGIGVFV